MFAVEDRLEIKVTIRIITAKELYSKNIMNILMHQTEEAQQCLLASHPVNLH